MNGFISYAHTDRRMVERLRRHLNPIKGSRFWFDGDIPAGANWKPEIVNALGRAKVILFCVTADLLWSDFVMTVEVAQARARHNSGEALVIPVILKDCMWEAFDFLAGLQAVPTNAKPVQQWKPQDPGYAEAARLIAAAMQRGMAAP